MCRVRISVQLTCTPYSGLLTVGPETLVKGSEWEDELPVQQGALCAVYNTFRYSAKSGVALYCVASEFDRHVVKSRRVWMPGGRRVHGKNERGATGSFPNSLDVLCVWFVDCYFHRAT
jgi:hypothetical protein